MAEDNIKEFTVNWMMTGFLVASLVAFAVGFMAQNGTQGFGADGDLKLNYTGSNFTSRLEESLIDSDTILNITANTNPEASDLGSRDSVATAYEYKGSAIGYWESSKDLLSWIFSGESGRMLIVAISGILAFTSAYYIVKYIRNGV